MSKGDGSSVTIASVDIGGGTTDLMICNYQPDPNVNIPSLTPTPLFWEGFNIAGDDIVKRIIEYILIPQIAEFIKDKGGNRFQETMNYMFGADTGEQTATHRIKRRQFANQIGSAFAFYVLNLAHDEEFTQRTIKLREIFAQGTQPENDLIPYLNREIERKTNLRNNSIDLMEIDINLNPQAIERSIRDIMAPVIDRLSKLIAQFDCDILLLCGRPSRLSIIKKMFVESLAVSPDQIVNLGGYRIGNWYPFATAKGVIKDPKTTVCVGALVGHLSKLNMLKYIKFDLKKFDAIRSTAKYIGVIGDESSPRITEQDLIFDNSKHEGRFLFHGPPVTIGMKQIVRNDWIATQIYRFDFRDDIAAQKSQDYAEPYTVQVSRGEGKSDVIDRHSLQITDANGEEISPRLFKLKFQTIANHGHWRETGKLLVDIIGR